MDVKKTDTKYVFDYSYEFCDFVINKVDDTVACVSVIGTLSIIKKIFKTFIRDYDVELGSIDMDAFHDDRDIYRLICDEDYVIDVEYIGNTDIGYCIDVIDGNTYVHIDSPMSVVHSIDAMGDEFEIFNIALIDENYDDVDHDEVNNEKTRNDVAPDISEIEVSFEPTLEAIELDALDRPQVVFNVAGDLHLTHYPSSMLD